MKQNTSGTGSRSNSERGDTQARSEIGDRIKRTADRARKLKDKLSKVKKEDPNIYPLF